MKNSFASRVVGAGAAGVLHLVVTTRALAAAPEDVQTCLDHFDIACAQAAAAHLDGSPAAVLARARIAFNLGDFPAALAAMESVAPTFQKEPGFVRELAHVRATADATDGFAVERRKDVEIRYQPGLDAVLLDEAFETLQATHDRVGTMLGGAPPGGVRMELYPSAQRFIAASGLPAESVRTTGVIALSKWTRLLVSSPRALGRGYAWKDTIAHEYVHYVVAWRTQNRTPVWLQEGIARSHESLWHLDNPPPLQPYQQSLLATALAGDTLVPLQKMHPSMAFLDSADEAALAFAQVSTMIEVLRENSGKDAVSRVLDSVRRGTDALQAVADVGAAGDKAAFMATWKQKLSAMNLVSRKLNAMPTVLGPAADDYGIDPALAARQDLAGHARLGELLMEAKRPDAALVEFSRAVATDEPPGPILAAHSSDALRALHRDAEAQAILERSVTDYPEYAQTRKRLASLYLRGGRTADALTQYRAGVDVNPFDPEMQAALADLYSAANQAELATRHARYRRLLQSGGLEGGEIR